MNYERSNCRYAYKNRNANTAKHDTVDVPASKMKISIAEILLKEGYIKNFEVVDVDNFKSIHITMKYGKDKNEKIISGLKRISKPGLRIYAGAEELPKVLGGLVLLLFPQTKVFLRQKSSQENVGGEVLAFVW
ncbi:MAG: 30S ribosomal protein S8 [Clostridium sp.]